MARRTRVALVIAVLVALGGTAAWMGMRPTSRTYSLEFTSVKGLYVGNPVDVLGVKVGEVTAIHPAPDKVIVQIRISGDRVLPSDVRASVVSPSVVPVRYVSLDPPYSGGGRLAPGATVPLSRTAVPVEWDEVKRQLVRLSDALGPNGANRNGSLSRLLRGTSTELSGQGAHLNSTIHQIAAAMHTVADNRTDLFAAVRNVALVVSALRASNSDVRAFTRALYGASRLLDADRRELGGVLDSMSTTFGQLRRFVLRHHAELTSTVAGIGRTVKLLADNRQLLADTLQVLPTTLSNAWRIGEPSIPGPTGALVLSNLDSPAQFICSAAMSLGGAPQQCINWLEPLARYLRLSQPPIGVANAPLGPGARQRTSAPSMAQLLSGGTP